MLREHLPHCCINVVLWYSTPFSLYCNVHTERSNRRYQETSSWSSSFTTKKPPLGKASRGRKYYRGKREKFLLFCSFYLDDENNCSIVCHCSRCVGHCRWLKRTCPRPLCLGYQVRCPWSTLPFRHRSNLYSLSLYGEISLRHEECFVPFSTRPFAITTSRAHHFCGGQHALGETFITRIICQSLLSTLRPRVLSLRYYLQ